MGARDLVSQGHAVSIFDGETNAGGFIGSQIPRCRLPERVIDEACEHILHLGVDFRAGQRTAFMTALLNQGWDAVFVVGCGAPRGRDLDLPGRAEFTHIGIAWLASVSFPHVTRVKPRVIVLGGGKPALDCCRSARRLGADDVKVIVRSGVRDSTR